MSLLNKDKADLDKDGKLSSYERKRGEAIEKSMKEKRKPYKAGKLIQKLGSKLSKNVKEAEKVFPGITQDLKPTRAIKPKEANELYQFLVDKVETGDDPAAFLQSLALDELKMISKGDTAKKAKLFDVFLDEMGGDISDIDKFLNAYIKVPTTSGDKLLTDLPMTSRAVNYQGGLLDDDMNRLALAEGPKGDGNLRAMLMQQKAMQMMQESPLDDVAYDQMLMDMEENPNISGFRKPHSGFDMFIQDQESKDMFLNLLKNKDEIFAEETRDNKAEGGEMLPDEEMEQNFIDFVVDEALSDKEKSMLEEQLEANPELSVLFDKVIERASEFTGAGPVDGPGTGTSDDIPARLSDGEFVFTAKAVEQIGADNLMQMMKDAEAAYDAGGERAAMQDGGEMQIDEDDKKVEVEYSVTRPMAGEQSLLGQVQEEDETSMEIKKSMMSPFGHVRS